MELIISVVVPRERNFPIALTLEEEDEKNFFRVGATPKPLLSLFREEME